MDIDKTLSWITNPGRGAPDAPRTMAAEEWFANDDNLDEAERLIRSGLNVWDVVVELECEIGNATSGTVEVSGLYQFVEDLGVELGRWQGPDPEPPDPMYVYKCYIEKEGSW